MSNSDEPFGIGCLVLEMVCLLNPHTLCVLVPTLQRSRVLYVTGERSETGETTAGVVQILTSVVYVYKEVSVIIVEHAKHM